MLSPSVSQFIRHCSLCEKLGCWQDCCCVLVHLLRWFPDSFIVRLPCCRYKCWSPPSLCIWLEVWYSNWNTWFV